MRESPTPLLYLALVLIPVLLAPTIGHAQGRGEVAPGDVIERGTFRVGTFGRALGEESYQLIRDDGSLLLRATRRRSDRGHVMELTARLRTSRDYQPERFELVGALDRGSRADLVVEVGKDSVSIRENGESRGETRPERLFTLAGYAPVAVQMMLARYWAGLESGGPVAVLPRGRVELERRGSDLVEVADSTARLDRYHVDGVVWGGETLWFDADMRLVAAFVNAAGIHGLEAVREGYEANLPFFSDVAEEEGLASWREISDQIEPERDGTFAIMGATLIDGTGRPARENSAVIIEDGRIAAVGPRSGIPVPDGAEVVDARGKTLLPGLWDMHAHFETTAYGPTYLAAGVTTVRDVGNELAFATRVRDAVRDGRALGPRMLLAGFVDGEGPDAAGEVHVGTPEEARSAVRRYHRAGFQQIKIYSLVKPELVPVIAAEAHRLGMTVTGHVPRRISVLKAVEAGMDQINHLWAIPPAMVAEETWDAGTRRAVVNLDMVSDAVQRVVRFLAEHGTILDPTLAHREMEWPRCFGPPAAFEPGVAKLPTELRGRFVNAASPPGGTATCRALWEKQLEIVGVLHEGGVPIVAGTDVTVPGHSLHRELELYVAAGMTPMEAIQAATSVPARAMGVEEEVGTVEAGKRADLILVDGDPLASISEIRDVEHVIIGGRMYETAPLWRSVGFRP